MDEVLAADLVFVLLACPDLRGAFHLEAGGSFRGLAPGLDAELVQAGGELLDELPDLVALGPGERASPAGAAGLEVVGAGGERLPEDDLFPFLEEELGFELPLVELGQYLAQLVQGHVVVDTLLVASRGGVLAEDAGGELVDVGDVDAGQQIWLDEGGKTQPQVGR